ncbi:hypothetical protein CDD83_3311 [Cordyceps sp. RAO-2017]|nr:hypothetical protein CDD83_3311 [Cordyceps sp. RAO-2017]
MPSSPHKRRKVEGSDTPQSAVSAISALAARRRLNASGAADTSSSPPISGPSRTVAAPSNPFSPLQDRQQKRASVTAPSKATPGQGSVRSRRLRERAPAAESVKGSSKSESRPVTYSSFPLSKLNYCIKGDVAELRLEENERFLIVGSFGIRVVAGEVTVAGAALRPSDCVHYVHAPHCHSLPVLRTAENTSLELHNHPEAKPLRLLGKLSPLFQNIWNDSPPETTEKRPQGPTTFQILGDSEDAPNGSIVQELVSPPKWNKKLASIVESVSGRQPPSIVVCGPKSSGKSTFSRLLTNRLLVTANAETSGSTRSMATGVAVLDLDPGQPEYAPPGTVSLVYVTQPNLGVPFTHPSLHDGAFQVLRCHSLASVNPASTTDLHLECALDLYDYYRHRLRNCPLIINTPGWVLSLGLELLVEVITKVRPAEVVYMSEDGPTETVDALQGATKNNFTSLPSQPSEFKSRTAAQYREMQAMSYFHSVCDDGSGGPKRLSWSPHALSSVRPLVVRYSGKGRGFLGILRYDYQLAPELIAEAINGVVLAIVEIEQPQAFRCLFQDMAPDVTAKDGDSPCSPLISWSPEGIPFISNPDDVTLDPRHSRTLGLALVRGVDTANKSLQILTPTPLSSIRGATSRGSSVVLVHGRFDPPTWSYTEHLQELAVEDVAQEQGPEVTEEDTSDEEGDATADDASQREGGTAVPWVETLKGNQKRPVGSKVWRVRRDLGRHTVG